MSGPQETGTTGQLTHDRRALVDVPCYVCGSTRSTPWASENGFEARRCSECGLVYVSPRPPRELIGKAAESGLHAGDSLLDVVGRYEPAKRRFYVARLAELYPERELRGREARWLDVGAGYGEFLEALALVAGPGLVRVGSEPNTVKAASARARGLDVTFRDLAQERVPYDYVSLLNVFSHLPDPPSFLDELRGLLGPRGELVLETGNWAELAREQIQDRLCLPDHLSFASEPLVARLLERSGFRVLRVVRRPMFRKKLVARVRGWFGESDPVPCDLWFRACVR